MIFYLSYVLLRINGAKKMFVPPENENKYLSIVTFVTIRVNEMDL